MIDVMTHGFALGLGFWSAILLPMTILSVSKRLWAFIRARKEG